MEAETTNRGPNKYGHDPHWSCAVCGRSYEDATENEIAIWSGRVAATGFCCEECREDNELPEDEETTDEREV